MYNEIRHCIVCKKPYKPYRQDQSTCGDKYCVYTSSRARKIEYKQEQKIKRKIKKRNGTEKAIDYANRADREGLSYGKLQELEYIERMKVEGFWKKK